MVEPRRPREPTGPSASRHAHRPSFTAAWALVAVGFGVALAICWVLAPRTELLGLLAGGAALAATIALHHVVVTRDLGEVTTPRPPEVDEAAPFRSRRGLLRGGLAGAAVVAVAGLVGLWRFAPRRPTGTAWADGVRAVTIDGSPIRPEDLPLGSVVTVWPETAPGSELGAVMLLRLREVPEPPTRMADVVDETLVAYSRLCTHAGCAVALYRAEDQALFCPCHQATFDARRGARPVSGPASHPLPQLPLVLDDDGFVTAGGDLSAPPGAVGGTVTT